MLRSKDTSSRLADLFNMESLILRKDLRQDKKSALLAAGRMSTEFRVPYAVTGGLAAQFCADQPRMTMGIDIVSLQEPFKILQQAAPWSRYGLKLVFDRRRFIKLKHVASNVEVDINVDTRFARLLDRPLVEIIEGLEITFVSAVEIAFAKLRTQRSDWPRDPARRLQDRADLIRIFRAQPRLLDVLRRDPDVTQEMRGILDGISKDLPGNDDLPEEPGEGDE